MFTTFRSAEIVINGLGDTQGRQLWRCIEQELIHPWFYLQVGRGIGDEVSTSMIMVQHAHELRELVDRQSKQIWLEEVLFVTPPHTNGEAGWLMESLEKIFVLKSFSEEKFNLRFDVIGGHSYFLNGTEATSEYFVCSVLFDATVDIPKRGFYQA